MQLDLIWSRGHSEPREHAACAYLVRPSSVVKISAISLMVLTSWSTVHSLRIATCLFWSHINAQFNLVDGEWYIRQIKNVYHRNFWYEVSRTWLASLTKQKIIYRIKHVKWMISIWLTLQHNSFRRKCEAFLYQNWISCFEGVIWDERSDRKMDKWKPNLLRSLFVKSSESIRKLEIVFWNRIFNPKICLYSWRERKHWDRLSKENKKST